MKGVIHIKKMLLMGKFTIQWLAKNLVGLLYWADTFRGRLAI